MATQIRNLAIIALFLSNAHTLFAQTSWKGTTSTNWSTSSNWTAGVPTSATDAILGDANFTGGNQPVVNSSASCKSLTVGGIVATTLTLSKNLAVSGGVTINANGTATQSNSTFTLSGNWTNNGTYATTNNNAKIVFGGVTQTIAGSSTTTFRKITVNTGSTVTLNQNINVSGSGSNINVYGTLNPGESPTYTVTSTVLLRVYDNGRIKVNGATFADNYILSGTVTLSPGCKVEYSSTTVNQTITNSYTYSTLIISGTGTKSLAGNLTALTSSSSTTGNILINSGTLDLLSYTANRGISTTGGEINVGNGAILKIGGTNTFPANYSTRVLTLSSTVEYYGTAQAVSAQTYGHLTLSSSSGAVTKTMPGTAFTIEGNFTSTIGAGTSVSYVAASNITINGNVNIGASTTFDGNSNSHTIRGNWINNGTFTGNTSTVSFDGPLTTISGAGLQNFNNINFLRAGITASSATINVSGNIATSGAGTFTHTTGLLTMTGASKTISGTNIIFDNLTISGSVTSGISFSINSNLIVSGSFSGTSGTVTMSGTSKTISGAGSIGFSSLLLTGSITTASSFSISTSLGVTGTFSATAGIATFTGTSILTGTANLYNVTINGTSLQLSFLSVLGIANTFTITAGTLNVTASIPNTVNFNGTGAQTINAIAYYHLTFSTGNTKTAAGAVTVNGNLTIAAATTFNGSTYTHTVLRNWINSGIYTASTGTVQFTGAANATITGVTTFNILTVNKSTATTSLSLLSNANAATVNMTTGTMLTGSNTLTITTTRSGNGIILGTITRTHSFGILTAYAFEGPDNTITFTAALGVTSVTVTVTVGSISDFPNGASINREYNITVPAGTYTAALRLHYEDGELNGNNESVITNWKYSSGSWVESGKTGNSTTSNYVEQSGLTNIAYRWSCSETPGVVRWNGSVSADWNTAANWTTIAGSPSAPPSSIDIVQIGSGAFTNQPTISNSVTVKSILFGSIQAATLTIASGGSLITNGNINGNWSGNATHTINAGNQNMTVNGSLALSNGVNNRSVNLNIGTGAVSVSGVLTQSGDASVTFTGAGSLIIGDNFNYTSGSFTAGSGTVTYNGTGAQSIGGVNYNNLTINKSTGIATLPNTTSVAGNLSVASGTLDLVTSSVTINGNVNISSGALIECDGGLMNVGGNWSNSGTYFSTTGSVVINGSGAQSISTTSFKNLTINKTSGTAALTGNISLEGDLTVQAGIFDLTTYTANRSVLGGTLTIAGGTTLLAGGSNNFPSDFTVNTLSSTSLVHYNGSAVQTVKGMVYGNLTFSNGGSNAKTQSANTTVAGDLLINSGATFHSGDFSTTLSGNWTNSGTFTASAGTVIFNGTAKTVTGNTTFNRLTVNGSYTVAGSDINYNSHLVITTGATYTAGSGIANVSGDLTNSGTLTSTGTTNFTGTAVQNIRLVNAILSSSTGIINFNGNLSPVLNSTSSPQFATLNINNTAGINPSVNWTVFVAMNVSTGAFFNGGLSAHTIYGSFSNSGTVTSTGTLNFTPSTAKTIALGSSGFSSDGLVNFGGGGLMTITGTPGLLNNLIISNTNSAGISAPSNWTIDSNFVVTSSAIFHAGSYTHTVGGNIESDGVLDGGTSTFVMSSSAGELTASSSTEFNHFTIAGTVTPQTDFRVAGNFSNNGTYDGTIGVLIMTGSNAASIGGTTTPSPISQLTIEKSSNAIVTQNVNLSNVLFFNVFSGIHFTSTRTITQDAGGGILLISDGATLRLGGTNSLPGFSGYGLDVNSNVDYAGTTQVVGNAANYGNLLITAAGNKNALVPFVVQGNLTISAGTLATSTTTVTHSIAGNFSMTGGALSGTTSTYKMDGVNNQTLTLLSNLINLTVNKSGGEVVLGSNVTVDMVTNFTAGKVNIGNYNFTVGSSGSITNYNSSKYFIATGTGTLIQQVTNGGSKVFPVGFTSTYLPATIALTGASTTDNFNVRLLVAVYSQGDNGSVITTNAVNATWMISEQTPNGSNANITLQWPSLLEMSGFNRTFSRLAHHKSSAWDYGPSDIIATGSNPYTVSRSGFTTFSPFAVGMLNALPVTWLGITGRNDNNNNIINWSTATEINNNYFVVEHSVDGINFIETGRVSGVINSYAVLQYSFTHYNINGEGYYYRIRQVDLDGKFSYSRIIRIVPSQNLIGSFNFFPNPVKDKATLKLTLQKESAIFITISDISGKIVFSKNGHLPKGVSDMQFDLSTYKIGVYTILVQDETAGKNTIRFIKQ